MENSADSRPREPRTMSKRTWSDEKKRVFEFSRNMCVSAGAGSGKTAALVELNSRFLSGETYLERLTMDEILAITFSEKAAGEMKERIGKMIDENLLGEKDAARIELWTAARRALISANISTFHSFCTRILRENPLEAGIDPLFQVAQEERAAELVENAAKALLARKLREKVDLIEELIMNAGFDNLARSLRSTLSKVVSSGDEPSSLDHLIDIQRREADALLEESRNELLHLVAELFDLPDSGKTKKPSKFQERIMALRASREFLEESIRSLTVSSLPESSDALSLLYDPFRKSVPDNVKALKEDMGKLLEPKKGILHALLRFFHSLPSQRLIASLIEELDGDYYESKVSQSLLDFDDLLRLCRRLLRDNLGIRRRYKKAFKVILVDEFQDTNELQRELIYLLAEREDRENPRQQGDSLDDIELHPCKLFVVGDAKQSIYFFRGADVDVFDRIKRDLRKKGGEILTFQENFRTLDSILEVINPFFSEVMGGTGSHVIFDSGDHLKPTRMLHSRAGRVELLLCDAQGRASQKRAVEAQALAQRILELTDGTGGLTIYQEKADGGFDERPARAGDIALLFRSLTQVSIYEEALRNFGIPYYLVKGRGFFGCQEILDVIQVLRFLTGMDRRGSLAAILRSPLGGCTDETLLRMAMARHKKGNDFVQVFMEGDFASLSADERLKAEECRAHLSHLEALKDRLTISELLVEIMRVFDYGSVLLSTFQGSQKVANLQKLVTMGRMYDARGTFGLEDFVLHVERDVKEESKEAEAQIADEYADVVKIMSIHQAKGLEFPVVIVPDLGKAQKSDSPMIRYSSRRGIAARYRDPVTGEAGDHYLFSLIKTEHQEKDRAESLRLLYVALTRARDYLILTGTEISRKETWRDLIIEFLGRDLLERFMESAEKEHILELTREHALYPRPYHFQVRLMRTQESDLKPPPKGMSPVELHPELKDPDLAELSHMSGPVEDLHPVSTFPEASDVIEGALSFSRPPREALYLTPTALAMYRFCRRRYLLDSLLSSGEGLSMPLSGDISPEAPAELLGWAAHRVLEELHFGASRSALSEEISNHLWQLGQRIPGLFKKTEPIMKAIEAFVDAPETAEMGITARNTVLWREHPFFLNFHQAIYLKGTIDLLARRGDNSYFLLDYKYSHEDEESSLNYRVQVTAYAYALSRLIPPEGLRAYLVFLLDRPTRFVEVPVSKSALGAFEDEFHRTAAEILEKHDDGREEIWEKAQEKGCRLISCPFMARCWGPGGQRH
jgi:ATP-dependent helicase/nuclease subunit A